VAKTTTLLPHQGNMPLGKDGITPAKWKPRCIKVYPIKGIILNADGLSGPGAEALIRRGQWQERTQPFFISFMSVGKTAEGRSAELAGFVSLLARHLPEFLAPVGLQINFTCPNVDLDIDRLVQEVKAWLKIASALGIALMPKFSVLSPVEVVKEVSDDPNCDAICVSNTIHWDDLPKVGIDRKRLFRKRLFCSDVSPLAKFGGGGLSGKPLLHSVVEWVSRAREAGIKKPINAGGGIFSPKDLWILRAVGANSVFIGSVATLRPWRVQKIIEKAYQLFKPSQNISG